VHVHVIEDDKLMTPLDESSKMLVEPAFLDMLFESGRKNAKTWLDQHFADIGARSTINLRAYFDVREVDLDTHPAEPAAPKQI
jgi:NTE family protein